MTLAQSPANFRIKRCNVCGHLTNRQRPAFWSPQILFFSMFAFGIGSDCAWSGSFSSDLFIVANRAWETLHAPFAFTMHSLLWPNPIDVHQWVPSNFEMFAYRFGSALLLCATCLAIYFLVRKLLKLGHGIEE